MNRPVIEILEHNQELETIFAKGIFGSVVLDIIPAALSYLRLNPEFKQMYLQDTSGAEFVIPQGCAVEQAVQNWQASKKGGVVSPKPIEVGTEGERSEGYMYF